MTLGEVASLEQFSERLRVAMRASVLWGDLGRDHGICYTRGILMNLLSKSWTSTAQLNTQVGIVESRGVWRDATGESIACWDSSLPPQGKGRDATFFSESVWWGLPQGHILSLKYIFYSRGQRELTRAACGSGTQGGVWFCPPRVCWGKRWENVSWGSNVSHLGEGELG